MHGQCRPPLSSAFHCHNLLVIGPPVSLGTDVRKDDSADFWRFTRGLEHVDGVLSGSAFPGLRLQPLCCTTTPGTIRLDSFNCSVHAPFRAPHRDSICRQSEYGGKPPRDRSCDDCGKQHWASLLYGCGKCAFATEMALANKPPRRI